MKEIPLELIKECQYNLRKKLGDLTELVVSIKQHGVLQPILLKEINGRYEVVVGLRRFQAAKIAGLKTIPAIIKDFDSEDCVLATLIENDQRKDLEWWERAEAYKIFKDLSGLSNAKIASLLGGISEDHIQAHLRAYEVLEKVGGTVRELGYSIVRRIAAWDENDWKALVEICIEKNYSRDELLKLRKNYLKFLETINGIKTSIPEVG